MVLPLILIGLGVASGARGIQKSWRAHQTGAKAKAMVQETQAMVTEAYARLDAQRATTLTALESLGAVRQDCWNTDLSLFVETFARIKGVELRGGVAAHELARTVGPVFNLLQEHHVTASVEEIVGHGARATGAGALAGLAAYGGIAGVASASTGAAISSLSGIAARNATLAWMGGGSIAAGGGGIAAGVVVLGGLVAGPVFLVGGSVWSAASDARLAAAETNAAKAKEAVLSLEIAIAGLVTIERLAAQYAGAIRNFRLRFAAVVRDLECLLVEAGTAFPSYTQAQKERCWRAIEYAGVMKKLLETPLLTEDGAVHPESPAPLDLAQALVLVQPEAA